MANNNVDENVDIIPAESSFKVSTTPSKTAVIRAVSYTHLTLPTKA